MQGKARLRAVTVADGSKELRKKFPAALFGGQTRPGEARKSEVWQGEVRLGGVR